VSKTFPTVGLIADGPTAWMYAAPARSLGIELVYLDTQEEVQSDAQKCEVVSIVDQSISLSIAKKLEADGVTVRPTSSAISLSNQKTKLEMSEGVEIYVMVARSPHGQATTWAPSEIVRQDGRWRISITPARYLTEALQEKAQKLALDFSALVGAVGVIAVEMSVKDEEVFIVNVEMHPQSSGNWTVDGSITSQYEQHLRAILDLPLGNPSMSAPYVVTGNFYCGEIPNMYRPYLHLMARTPALKFHQYKSSCVSGELMGHITLAGDDLSKIIDEVDHALQYMQGEIDE
jgi:phosphoribosylaminoimidazole carboxylase (NCAIR synthetase)